jgi:hypothetical protein
MGYVGDNLNTADFNGCGSGFILLQACVAEK